jgi:hypothetical protein
VAEFERSLILQRTRPLADADQASAPDMNANRRAERVATGAPILERHIWGCRGLRPEHPFTGGSLGAKAKPPGYLRPDT